MHLCHFVRRHADVRGNGHLIFLHKVHFCVIDNTGGSVCETLGDFNRSLTRFCYFVCAVDERASFVSFACAIEGAR